MLYNKKIDLSDSNDSLSQIFKLIRSNSVVLDIGCATGALASKLANLKQCQVYGLEFNPESVKICRQKKVFTQVSEFNLNNINTQSFPQYKGKFDYIVCADVLEHLTHPEQTLNILQTYLAPNGKIIISLPNIAHASIKTNLLLNDFSYTDIGILDRTHLRFFTYKSIAKLLTDSGLNIIKAHFITLPLDGWQPHKLSELPPAIAKFIEQDAHSHIMQYIVLCSCSKSKYKHNLNMLNTPKQTATNSFKQQIKRFLVNKTPYLLKTIEKIRH